MMDKVRQVIKNHKFCIITGAVVVVGVLAFVAR
jgi:hypothetical protein